MLTYLFLSFFITNVYAETVETPYLLANSSKDLTREIQNTETIYYLKKEGEISKNYYREKPAAYDIRTNEFIYDKYSDYTSKNITDNNLAREEVTFYHYLELEQIDYLAINYSKGVTILDLKLNNEKLTSCNNTYRFKKKKLEDSILEVKLLVAVNSNANYLEVINNDLYLKEKITIKDKGIVTIRVPLINCLTKLKFSKKEKVTTDYNDLPYYKLLRKEKLYRYRRKLYKYKKRDIFLTSNSVLPGYQLERVETLPRIYRK